MDISPAQNISSASQQNSFNLDLLGGNSLGNQNETN
jgi:hypothetical protein